MDVPMLAWVGLAAIIFTMLAVDFLGHVRKPHAPSLKEAAWWSLAYVVMALVFGVIVWAIWGSVYGGEYFAGYITEKSLSVDNLFVFVIIIAAFRVPRDYQQQVLLVGIIIALVLRGAFIAVGAVAINQFAWIFYIFGAFLLYTAYAQAKEGVEEPGDDEDYQETALVRWVRKVFPVTEGFVGGKLLHRHAGTTYITPMLIVILAIGTADVMFAVDSIPAIFGLTQEPYLVFAANAFSLLGLRQLYFLIDGLLDRLVYLHYGLAAILAFIGAKLIIHALHENSVPFINGGEEWHGLPEPTTTVSLLFIIGVLAITVVASLAKNRRAERLAKAEPKAVTTPDEDGGQDDDASTGAGRGTGSVARNDAPAARSAE